MSLAISLGTDKGPDWLKHLANITQTYSYPASDVPCDLLKHGSVLLFEESTLRCAYISDVRPNAANALFIGCFSVCVTLLCHYNSADWQAHLIVMNVGAQGQHTSLNASITLKPLKVLSESISLPRKKAIWHWFHAFLLSLKLFSRQGLGLGRDTGNHYNGSLHSYRGVENWASIQRFTTDASRNPLEVDYFLQLSSARLRNLIKNECTEIGL